VYAGIKVVLPKELGRSSRNVSQFVHLYDLFQDPV
jgi:hypothetical protein